MNKRKIAIILCACALAVSGAVGGSLAYLSDTDSVSNVFTIGNIGVDITEPDWNPADGDGQDMLPGSTYDKSPTVTETAGDSYMRVQMRIVDTASGDVITDTTRVNKILDTIYYDAAGTHIAKGTSYAASAISAYKGFNTDFTYDTTRNANAGVRYYNYTANGGRFVNGTSASLFTNVVVPLGFSSADLSLMNGDTVTTNGTIAGAGYSINLTVQAIQFDNIASAAAAYTALDD
ncbi:MAG: TasA family protein [Oscillospiraceae bacterium]